jgi:hypothetical protein
MKFVYRAFIILILLGGCGPDEVAGPDDLAVKVVPPPTGIYHSAFPDFAGSEDTVTIQRIIDFEALVSKKIVWAYFSNNWLKDEGIKFPDKSVKIIHKHGSVPYIRMMPRSGFHKSGPDPIYTMQHIIDGVFDNDLICWAEDAKQSRIPLIVEFGTEVNGDWFSWNGRWNGGSETKQYGDPEYPDGPERFRDAYRHIINLFQVQNVKNITWVFHVDAKPEPEESWNNMAAYYPGDNYIDWLGISMYGAQVPGETWWDFTEIMDGAYAEVTALSPEKPVCLLEFGVIDDAQTGDKASWIKNAFVTIKSGRYPRLKAISYWHETFTNDDGSLTNLRLDSSPVALKAYRDAVADSIFVEKAYYTYKKDK